MSQNNGPVIAHPFPSGADVDWNEIRTFVGAFLSENMPPGNFREEAIDSAVNTIVQEAFTRYERWRQDLSDTIIDSPRAHIHAIATKCCQTFIQQRQRGNMQREVPQEDRFNSIPLPNIGELREQTNRPARSVQENMRLEMQRAIEELPAPLQGALQCWGNARPAQHDLSVTGRADIRFHDTVWESLWCLREKLEANK